jgi:hypothetical protein
MTVLRIGNASGFYGDRFSAVREMLEDGPLDVLTGDYLAELTMLILGRDRMKNPGGGYAKTFLRQMEECLGLAMHRGVRIVTNAGGLNPAGLADALGTLAGRLGIEVKVAHVTGDDLMPRAAELGLGRPLTANAYLGAFGIARCLAAGADVVVTGRVTDASLVVGPAAHHFGWSPTDYDSLAGATVAGHLLECGAQATGGNYAFFTEHELTERGRGRPGFPLAEIQADGSSVLTKHPGTAGAVTVGTVTAQLLYEIDGPRYAGPDVTTRFDTVRLTQQGPDRVRVSGVVGEPPPPTVKVCLNRMAGFRNEVTFVLTGLDIEAKAALVRAQLTESLAQSTAGLAGGGRPPEQVRWTLARTDHPDADTQEAASALLRLTVKDADLAVVGRAFTAAAVEIGLSSYPGFALTATPADGTPYGIYSAAYVDRTEVEQVAVLPDGTRVLIEPATKTQVLAPVEPAPTVPWTGGEPLRHAPLGLVVGARSGDKGGTANIGVWARTERVWPWLGATLTPALVAQLLPEAAGLPITRHVLPHLRALNFVVDGLLGEGVAAGTRFDPQGKGLGEWLRSRHLDIPEYLL